MPLPGYVFKKGTNGLELLRTVSNSVNAETHSDTKIRRPSEKYFERVLLKIDDRSLDYAERTQAVVEMRGLLGVLDSNIIPEIWFATHSLIAAGVPRATRRSALELLQGCISHTRDDLIKSIFFQIIYDCLVPPGKEEKLSTIDPDLDLILHCFNEIASNADDLLTNEEKELMTEIVADLINLPLQQDPGYKFLPVILELLDLSEKLSIPLNSSDVGTFLDTLGKISETANRANMRFQTASINFIKHYQNGIKLESLDDVALILINISAIMAQDKVDAILRPLLQLMVDTAQNQAIAEKFCMLPLRKPIDRGVLVKCYASVYVEAFAKGKISPQEVFAFLNKLFVAKLDSELLETSASLLSNEAFVTNWKMAEQTTKISLWPMIEKALVRTKWSLPQVIDSLLRSMTCHPTLIPMVPEEIIHFICQSKLPINFENLMFFLEDRIANIREVKTMQQLTNFVVQGGVSTTFRLSLIQFFKLWLEENKFNLANFEPDLADCIWSFYHKFETMSTDDRELESFGELLYIFMQLSSLQLFESFITCHLLPTIRKILLHKSRRRSFVGSIGTFGRGKTFSKVRLKILPILVKNLVKAFIWSPLERTGGKCCLSFEALISVYEYAEQCKDSTILLIIARSMVRIRRDGEGAFYFADPEDAVGISSAFGRHREQIPEEAQVQWTFPETLDFIDTTFLGKRNECIKFEIRNGDTPSGKIKMGVWLSLAVSTIEDPVDLEIYSYLLTHLCSQLSELTLFEGHYKGINTFKNVICQHLRQSLPSTVKPSDTLSRSDLNSAYVRNLSAVLAYHRYEPKIFADDLISALVFGLTSWEKTLIPILHILTVSCFEIPTSVKRYITPILLELQKRITTLHAVPSILEFLLALKSSPPLISNLTPNETKRIFAVVFTLLENSVYLKMRSKSFSQNPGVSPQRLQFSSLPQDYEVEISPSTEGFLVGDSMTRFFQYQSFTVLANWLFSVKGDQMNDLIQFVMKGLEKLAIIDDLKYDSLAYMDFVSRLNFSTQEEVPLLRGKDDHEYNDSSHLGRWISGSCLISIRTWDKTDRVVVELKRPSSESIFEIKLFEQPHQPKYTLFDFQKEDEPKAKSFPSLKPEQVLHLVHIQGIRKNLFRLPNNAAFNRSVNILERIPKVEFQKTGIIYIGPGQCTEFEVLNNSSGSHQYNWFLTQMGDFIKLKETSQFFYRGGLDPETDGEYALVWNNPNTQITFHTVTLMPPNCDLSFKKRHVGNDFVNIFYNDSGLYTFNFNLIKSQFTFINIVITPEFNGSNNKKISQHYKVKLYRRSGVPGLLSCAHFKILDKSNLARYVRHVSLIANALAEKYNETGSQDACSTWGVRCKQLLSIRDRAAQLAAN
ncbi:uncharacterized protein ZBAI_02820 [Zygosaccharomyces bailii ISA1307]|nr:uncharacterized protein ZBAI_02820 [Zygosaccharomyces bailii ISA1307]